MAAPMPWMLRPPCDFTFEFAHADRMRAAVRGFISSELRTKYNQRQMRPSSSAPGEITVEGILHALSDPVRASIFAEIAGSDCSQSCSSFLTVSAKAVPKSTLSHHFKVLREAGLIRSEEAASRYGIRRAVRKSTHVFRLLHSGPERLSDSIRRRYVRITARGKDGFLEVDVAATARSLRKVETGRASPSLLLY